MLNILLKMLGVKVNDVLANNKDLRVNKRFLKGYLEHDFDTEGANNLIIIEVLKDYPLVSDKDLINSKYFRSMPDDMVVDALEFVDIYFIDKYDKFKEWLLKRIDNKKEFQDLLRYRPTLINGNIEMIFATGDLDFIIEMYGLLSKAEKIKFTKILNKYLRLEDVEKFFLTYYKNLNIDILDMEMLNIAELLRLYDSFMVVNAKKTIDSIFNFLYKLERDQKFRLLLSAIYKKYNVDNIRYLEQKIIDINDLDLMFNLVIIAKNKSNNISRMLDILIDNKYRISDLLLVSNYEDYILKKLSGYDILEVLEYFRNIVDNSNVGRIESLVRKINEIYNIVIPDGLIKKLNEVGTKKINENVKISLTRSIK